MSNLTNEIFLDTLLGAQKFIGLGDPWVCSFHGVQSQWKGRPYSPALSIELEESSNFFCISLMKQVNGVISRKKENFAGMLCVALDDIGTKAKPPMLPPSWKFETSPGNEQWGYLLKVPLMDAEKADSIQKAVIAAGYCDAGAGGPSTRYMRLPVGSNSKPEHIQANDGKPWRVIVKEWHPEKRFSIDEIVTGLALKFETERPSPDTSVDIFQHTDLSKFRSRLKYIPPFQIGYETWSRIGMALYHETNGSLEGLNLWDEWSKGNV